jgi:hypothetical protein
MLRPWRSRAFDYLSNRDVVDIIEIPAASTGPQRSAHPWVWCGVFRCGRALGRLHADLHRLPPVAGDRAGHICQDGAAPFDDIEHPDEVRPTWLYPN